MAREEPSFDDPIEEIASHWDETCSTVSFQRWDPDSQKYVLVDKFPSPPTFKEIKEAGPGTYRLTIYRLQGKGVKHHCSFMIGGKVSPATPPRPEPQHTHLTEERIAKIAAEAATAAVKPLLDRVGMMGPPPDPFAAIEKSFKMVAGIFTSVNQFGAQIAEQQSNAAKTAEAEARRRIAAEERMYDDDEEDEGEQEEQLDAVEKIMKGAANMIERKGMKLLSGEAKTPDAVEDEWGVGA